ncbi:MFS transporter [Umezawaea beigongshangensis]|uniref:MFS transporter n=1 Tax=Umezawaea beigongshangensis TaxID=2780383 RepID=UPI0018F1F125|nr:MFS transporter [Umezawaea beigongshangensis]
MTTSLARNRAYGLLWGGQAISETGFSASMFAFPLLALAVTGSAAQSGTVLGAVAVVQLVVGLPAGALADRWNRKKIMLACEAAQAVALAGLVLALWTGAAGVVHLIAAAAVIGLCRALFEPAEDATLPRLVSTEQVPAAVAMNAARSNAAQLGGTALGGVLFAAGRIVPFVFDVVTHVVAFVALLFVRVPPHPAPTGPAPHLGRDVVEGVRWVWGHRRLRVTALCAISVNLFFSAYYLVIVVLGSERGVGAAELGVMAAMLGAGGILGALAAPRLHARFSPYALITGVFWGLTLLTPLAVFLRSGYATGVLFAAMAFLAPAANTAITTHQLLLTPDRLRGRLSGVMGVASGVAAAAGPAVGGLLAEFLPDDRAVLVCAAAIAVVTVLAAISPTLRGFSRDPAPEDESPELDRTSGSPT